MDTNIILIPYAIDPIEGNVRVGLLPNYQLISNSLYINDGDHIARVLAKKYIDINLQWTNIKHKLFTYSQDMNKLYLIYEILITKETILKHGLKLTTYEEIIKSNADNDTNNILFQFISN